MQILRSIHFLILKRNWCYRVRSVLSAAFQLEGLQEIRFFKQMTYIYTHTYTMHKPLVAHPDFNLKDSILHGLYDAD